MGLLTTPRPEVRGFLDHRESNDFTLTKIHCDVPHRCMRENPYVPQEGEISQEITPLARQVAPLNGASLCLCCD